MLAPGTAADGLRIASKNAGHRSWWTKSWARLQNKRKAQAKMHDKHLSPFDPHPFDGAMAHRAAMSGSAELSASALGKDMSCLVTFYKLQARSPAIRAKTSRERLRQIPALQITHTVNDVWRVATAKEWIAKNFQEWRERRKKG
jgi:hypothetical protein